MEQKITAVWPEWEPVRLLGEGSFGRVYEVVRNQHGIEERAAVKVIAIPSNYAEVNSLRSEGMSDREITNYYSGLVKEFTTEIAMMSRLKGYHNIVSYEDYAVVERRDGWGWDILIRMELLTSLPLYMGLNGYDTTIRTRPFDEREIVRMGIELCTALEVCAKHRIVHRDIKPDNIFVSNEGHYKIGDFGVAKTIDKTIAGLSKKGTYTYMAPEIYKGEPGGLNSDLYSLGIVLYKLLNDNREPFMPPVTEEIQYEDKTRALVRRMNGEKIIPPRNGTASLVAVIQKACAYDPRDRYQSPTHMKEDLKAVLRDVPSKTPSVSSIQKNKPIIVLAFISLVVIFVALFCGMAVLLFTQWEALTSPPSDITEPTTRITIEGTPSITETVITTNNVTDQNEEKPYVFPAQHVGMTVDDFVQMYGAYDSLAGDAFVIQMKYSAVPFTPCVNVSDAQKGSNILHGVETFAGDEKITRIMIDSDATMLIAPGVSVTNLESYSSLVQKDAHITLLADDDFGEGYLFCIVEEGMYQIRYVWTSNEMYTTVADYVIVSEIPENNGISAQPSEHPVESPSEPNDSTLDNESLPLFTEIIVSPGMTVSEIAEELANRGICTATEFLTAVNLDAYDDYSYIAELSENDKVGRTYLLEGYLYPQMYTFQEKTPADQVVRQMLDAFDEALTEEMRDTIKDQGYTIDEMITIASIAQCEVNDDINLPRVTRVIRNRLERDNGEFMHRLQMESTYDYASEVAGPLGVSTYYDTFEREGLPVGAIGNPNITAILAALFPSTEEDIIDCYYFSGKDTGEVKFSETYEEHATWRNENEVSIHEND